ncbi:MAG: ATP-binding cassette domain-containing protein [Rhodospirillales bacterium]|nr:ATP-binding cassette domain-containing protein [Rhodospirillales bacterium]
MKPPSILPLRLDRVVLDIGGKRVIKDVSATLTAAPCSIVLGPNGAGKTLLLKLCHGLIAPTAGSVTWAGAPCGNVQHAQAMVFQQPVMLRRSVAANIAYALTVRGRPRAEQRARIDDVLARTGLRRFAESPARRLSVGEKQRLALARAWAIEPQVLFLDEPTASLDPAGTRQVEEIILAIHRGGTKVIMTTHDLQQARRLADEVMFLHRGRLYEQTPAAAFFTAPRTPEAQRFLEGTLFPNIRRVV